MLIPTLLAIFNFKTGSTCASLVRVKADHVQGPLENTTCLGVCCVPPL